MQITIVKQDHSVRVPRQYLLKALKLFLKKLPKKDQKRCLQKELTLVFVSKASIQALNKQFRNKNKPTDVLSFDALEPDSLGELVFSAEVLSKQSKEHELTFRDELVYMLYHGVLHLCGYDHEDSAAEAKKMFAIQDKAFHDFLNWEGGS